MLHQSCAIVLRAVRNRPAYRGTRQDFVIRVLPSHRKRRQMPVGRARHTRAVRVRRLVAGRALQRSNAFALRPTHHVEPMPMSVVGLLRITVCGVAVDAARMRHHRINLLPCRQAFSSARTRPRARTFLVTRTGSYERGDGDEDGEEAHFDWTHDLTSQGESYLMLIRTHNIILLSLVFCRS